MGQTKGLNPFISLKWNPFLEFKFIYFIWLWKQLCNSHVLSSDSLNFIWILWKLFSFEKIVILEINICTINSWLNLNFFHINEHLCLEILFLFFPFYLFLCLYLCLLLLFAVRDCICIHRNVHVEHFENRLFHWNASHENAVLQIDKMNWTEWKFLIIFSLCIYQSIEISLKRHKTVNNIQNIYSKKSEHFLWL